MSLFRKIFGGQATSHTTNVADESQFGRASVAVESEVRDGPMDLEVVGEASYQENIWKAIGGRISPRERVRVDVTAVLMAEKDNPYDENAISVWVRVLKVGYLSRENALKYRTGLVALQERVGKVIALPGVVVGGGVRADGPGMLGVFLRHDPTDFGLRRPSQPAGPGSTLMTGLSEAIATDAADDSYDLSWLISLPSDAIGTISRLRRLLEHELDPIDRHFMFHHVEEALYRCREAFASALDDYDESCRAHDAEMEGVCSAFMAKWGKIPWLQTYKQMCIRLAKAKRFDDALRWAERGLALYGGYAARPDAVDDLRRRADSYRAKLGI